MAEQENDSYQVGGRKVATYICKPCENKGRNTYAVVYCRNCEEYQCEECRKVHDMGYTFMKGHVLVGVTQAEIETAEADVAPVQVSKTEVDMAGWDICSEHKKVFEFYCEEENTLCCSECLLRCIQRGCKNVSKLSEKMNRSKPDISDVQSGLTELETSANRLIQFLQETKESTGSELEAIVNQIECIKQAVVKKCDDLKASVRETIEDQIQTKTDEFDSKLCDAERMVEQIGKTKKIVMAVSENGSEDQKFIASFVVKGQNSNFQTEIQKQMNNIYRPIFSLKR